MLNLAHKPANGLETKDKRQKEKNGIRYVFIGKKIRKHIIFAGDF